MAGDRAQSGALIDQVGIVSVDLAPRLLPHRELASRISDAIRRNFARVHGDLYKAHAEKS